ncbi:MAG: hypothetical protein IPK01_13305 [Acidobacteria bacterium]|nr:hypothetical protein [Acidobacteriota bacterium]
MLGKLDSAPKLDARPSHRLPWDRSLVRRPLVAGAEVVFTDSTIVDLAYRRQYAEFIIADKIASELSRICVCESCITRIAVTPILSSRDDQ